MPRLPFVLALLALFLVPPPAAGARVEQGRDASPGAAATASAERDEAFLVARIRPGASVDLRSRPRGAVVARLGSRTEFGSPRVLGVVERRGAWLGVTTPVLGNRRLGWVKLERRTLRLARTRLSLTLDLSRRALVLKAGRRVVRRMTVGIGAPDSPTPIGRFAVTDELPGARYGPYYGCCIVALSARQPRLPAGWRGGDRIAIHGTNAPSSIGAATSAGCPHARDSDLRALIRRVPLGTPVFVRA